MRAVPSETRADPGGKLPPKPPFPAPPLGIWENLGGREGGELTLLGIENLTASFFFFSFFFRVGRSGDVNTSLEEGLKKRICTWIVWKREMEWRMVWEI